MKRDQFIKLIEYIDAAIIDGTAGPEGLHENIAKYDKRKELYDSFFKANEEYEIELALLEETSKILQKTSGESVADAARRIMKEREEYLAFFKNLLDPEMYGWAVNEEVRNEAREFLGIPIVKKKK